MFLAEPLGLYGSADKQYATTNNELRRAAIEQFVQHHWQHTQQFRAFGQQRYLRCG